MKTKIIRLNSEIKDDLKYCKYCVDDFWARPFVLRDKPKDFSVEQEYNALRNQAIKDAVNGGKIISTSSRLIISDFVYFEEITINYE